jgi:hypothetical protein
MVKDGNFAADTIIFDGYAFDKIGSEDLSLIQQFGKELDIEIWFSVSLGVEETEVFDENGIPVLLKPFLDSITVLITLKFSGEHVQFQAVKDHDQLEPRDMHLMLDPKSLLIAEK